MPDKHLGTALEGILEQYLTTGDVAHLCRTTSDTVRYWRHVGRGPASFRVGRRVLYAQQDVEAWLTQLRDSSNGKR